MKINTRPFFAAAALSLATLASAAPVRAQSVVSSVNASASPADEFWTAASIGWFYTPSTSFTLRGVNTQFFAAGGTDRNVTIELLTAPRFDGGTLLTSGTFNTSAARGGFGGATFVSTFDLIANTPYFVGFRNTAPPGAGDFSLVPESELLRANYTGDAGATIFSALRFDFEDDGQYEFEMTDGTPTQPMLQFIGVNAATTVPEPGTVVLFGMGLVLVVFARRRRLR
ncbi:MAG: PEP-CTERM sorting domain-containing protein [Phycisphaerae bacterium]|nr:PEP-CTERM sorting domain-containing protein [Gemmatimonadaceae bacterium]